MVTNIIVANQDGHNLPQLSPIRNRRRTFLTSAFTILGTSLARDRLMLMFSPILTLFCFDRGTNARVLPNDIPFKLGLNCFIMLAKVRVSYQDPSPPVTKDTPRCSLKTSRILVAVAPTPAEIESPTAAMMPTSWGLSWLTDWGRRKNWWSKESPEWVLSRVLC